MSKNILKQLFDGEIYPSENLCIYTPEYKRINGALMKEKEHFEKTLTDSDSFQKIEDLHHELTEIYSYESFVTGYRLGIMLLFEALKGNNAQTADE